MIVFFSYMSSVVLESRVILSTELERKWTPVVHVGGSPRSVAYFK
jgi:hypothetical protein